MGDAISIVVKIARTLCVTLLGSAALGAQVQLEEDWNHVLGANDELQDLAVSSSGEVAFVLVGDNAVYRLDHRGSLSSTQGVRSPLFAIHFGDTGTLEGLDLWGAEVRTLGSRESGLTRSLQIPPEGNLRDAVRTPSGWIGIWGQTVDDPGELIALESSAEEVAARINGYDRPGTLFSVGQSSQYTFIISRSPEHFDVHVFSSESSEPQTVQIPVRSSLEVVGGIIGIDSSIIVTSTDLSSDQRVVRRFQPGPAGLQKVTETQVRAPFALVDAAGGYVVGVRRTSAQEIVRYGVGH